MDQCTAEGMRPSTIRRRASSLRGFFSGAGNNVNIPYLRGGNTVTRRQPLMLDEIERLLTLSQSKPDNTRDGAIIATGLNNSRDVAVAFGVSRMHASRYLK